MKRNYPAGCLLKRFQIQVCGPPPMINAIAGPKGPNYTQGEVGGFLKKLGYNSDNVFKF
jgi:cytochrome-b5 reductase